MAEVREKIDEYELINCIATGTHSQVWEVVDRDTSIRYAMKLLLPEAFGDSGQRAVLRYEAKVAKSLEHPNLIEFFEVQIDREHAYLIMDYFRAPNLRQQMSVDLERTQERLDKLMDAVCAGVGHMHNEGWVHKDLKPENILMDRHGEVRIIDFALAVRAAGGLSKLLGGGKSKSIQGTRSYIAPETIRKGPSTPQTDIYSIGITLYELFTGKTPFKGATPSDLLIKHIKEKPVPPSDVNRNVTTAADQFILRMLSKKPTDRHASMAEVLSEYKSIKIFNEDPFVIRARRDRKGGDLADVLAERLDSRLDAQRSAASKVTGNATPPKSPPPEAKPAPPKAPPAAAPQSQPPAPTPPPAQQPPQPYQQPMPPQPPVYPPGMPPQPMQYPYQQPMPQHGYPQPGMPAAGYPYQQYPPGMVPPGQQMPGMPPQQPPQPPAGQPAAPPAGGQQQPPTGAQTPGQGGSPAPPPPKPQPPPVKPEPEKDDEDDLPFMEELPPIL